MKLFAWLEAYRFAWGNRYLRACPWIASNSGFARFNCEDTEAAQFNAVARDEGLLHAFEDCVYRRFRFRSRQACALNNPLYKILLNHLGRRPWLYKLTNKSYRPGLVT
jgi:hypothetical protein